MMIEGQHSTLPQALGSVEGPGVLLFAMATSAEDVFFLYFCWLFFSFPSFALER